MENNESKNDLSTIDETKQLRRLSAPAKLQTFDIEEPTVIKNRESVGNLHLLYSDNRSLITRRSRATIHHHYFPEGGWGVIVAICVSLAHAITAGTQISFVSALRYFFLWTKQDSSLLKSGNLFNQF